MSWWRGEGNATDEVGGATGTLQGRAGFVEGQVGQALHFDGVDDAVLVTPGGDPGSESFTVEAWIRTSAGRTMSSIVSKYAYAQMCASRVPSSGYFFGVDGPLVLVINDANTARTDQYQYMEGTVSVADDRFHHVAFVRAVAAKEVRFFVDGALDATARLSGDADGDIWGDDGKVASLVIGAMICHRGESRSAFFAGDIDELSYYTRALTPDEIRGIYDAGRAGKSRP